MIKQIMVIVIIAAVIVYGKIISVPGDFGTIQEGINNSAHTDTVLVSPGIFYENINFSGKNITLASLFLTTRDTSYTSQTIINGGGTGRVVNISNGESADAKLIGFTITNGYSITGSGIYINGSSPEVSFNIIKDNQIGWYGTGCGIYMKQSSSEIMNNFIQNNDGAFYGSGILIDSCYTVNIRNNIICDNITNSGYGVAGNCAVSITNSEKVYIKNCLFYENYVDFGEGDMIGSDESTVFIENCTFYNKYNGFSLFDLGSSSEIKNSIIFPDKFYSGQIFNDSIPVVSYSNLPEQTDGIGNISIDPLFSDYVSFGLKQQSQCINGGDPLSDKDPDYSIADMGWKSFELSQFGTITGNVTLEYGTGSMENVWITDGSEVCFPLSDGLYKINLLPGTYSITANLGISESSTADNISVGLNETISDIDFHFTNDIQSRKITVSKDGSGDFKIIQDAVNICIDGDTIIVKEGEYNEELYINDKIFILASEFILDGDSIHIGNTKIDGKNTFRPVYIENVIDTGLVINGLTIQNGYADTDGGGVYIKFSRPGFKNCIIKNNTSKQKGGGILNSGGFSVFDNCRITYNHAGSGGGFYNSGSNIKIINSSVSYNSSYSSGAINNYYSDTYIVNSDIVSNSATYTGAITNAFDSELILIGCIVTENNSVSSTIEFDRYNKPGLVMNNLIANNNITGNSCVIYIRDSSPIFINNTITKNNAPSGSTAIYIYSQNSPYSSPEFYNNIIWNNITADSTQIAIYDDDTVPDFYNNLIQYGKENFKFLYNATPENNIGDYINNIDLDPLFLDEWNGDYFLTENSSCIDAGTVLIPDSILFPDFDLANNARIYGSTIDIGTYEWQGSGIEDNSIPQTTELHQNYPNPFNPETSIKYSLSNDAQVKLTVYDIGGREAARLVSEKQARGNYDIKFNGGNMTSGLYFYRLDVDGKTVQSRKMMLLK